MDANLTTLDDEKENPVFSCPDCDSEDIDASPPPSCNECGADGNQYDQMTDWIACPDCGEREITVHGTPQYKDTNFRLNCGSCDYEAELLWM
jgi:predicted RNA-binding Zn-ribbon protein involved in translation (DUF1610 family)